MAANYLHGVETIEVERGPRPVRTVKSAVIGLIGTAPIGAVNVATLTLSEKDAAAFGSQLPGFTIPQALDAIYDHGAGTVIVINVLDPATHKTAVANEAIAFDASTDRVKLAHGAVASLVLKSTDGATTYVAGTDYELRDGVLYIPGTSTITAPVAGAANLKVTYAFAAQKKVQALVNANKQYELVFVGLNEARSGKRTRIVLHKVSGGVLQEMAVIGEEFGAGQVNGSLLSDGTKVGDGVSQYFTFETED